MASWTQTPQPRSPNPAVGKEVLPGAGTPLSCPRSLGAAPVYTAVLPLAGCVNWGQGFTFSIPSSVCRTEVTMRVSHFGATCGWRHLGKREARGESSKGQKVSCCCPWGFPAHPRESVWPEEPCPSIPGHVSPSLIPSAAAPLLHLPAHRALPTRLYTLSPRLACEQHAGSHCWAAAGK